MPAIYAKIQQIAHFQEHWDSLSPPLEAAISDRDTRISNTRRLLENGVMEAGEIRDRAHRQLVQAQEEVEIAKRSPDGPSHALSQRLEQCERACEQATRQLERLEAQQDRFAEVSQRCAARQDQALTAIKQLGNQGSGWLARYIQLLHEAKRALYEDVTAGGGSFLTPDGGYIGARTLTGEERTDIQEKTGWTEKQLNKCQIRPDGSLWYKTTNCEQDMERYKGVWFQRDTVIINGVRVEGIFPQFNSLFEPDSRLPESIWSRPREVHFAWCRAQLKVAVENTPSLAAHFTAAERKLIAAEEPLPDYTWHHHQHPGKMQLVRTKMLRKALHTVGHTGGYTLWCSPLQDD